MALSAKKPGARKAQAISANDPVQRYRAAPQCPPRDGLFARCPKQRRGVKRYSSGKRFGRGRRNMTETVSCPEISVLSSFLDGEFEQDKDLEVTLHVQNCASCADRVKRFQAADRLMRKHLAEPMTPSGGSLKEGCISPELMTAYRHDLLAADEKRRVEAHLDGCDACIDELNSLTKATIEFERSNQAPVPSALRQRV